jgi:hypothetical protein
MNPDERAHLQVEIQFSFLLICVDLCRSAAQVLALSDREIGDEGLCFEM